MFNITKASSKSQAFIAELSQQNKSRSLPVSIALARLIAIKLPLPTAEVECINAFYNTQSAVQSHSLISQLNDIVILDVDTVKELVKRYYMYRYQQVYMQEHVLLRSEHALVDFFKISKVFDDATLEAIGGNHVLITECTTRFIDLLQEIGHES